MCEFRSCYICVGWWLRPFIWVRGQWLYVWVLHHFVHVSLCVCLCGVCVHVCLEVYTCKGTCAEPSYPHRVCTVHPRHLVIETKRESQTFRNIFRIAPHCTSSVCSKLLRFSQFNRCNRFPVSQQRRQEIHSDCTYVLPPTPPHFPFTVLHLLLCDPTSGGRKLEMAVDLPAISSHTSTLDLVHFLIDISW